MSWVDLLILGVVIASNNFAASLALGALDREKNSYKIIGVFGVSEFSIPFLGIWLGKTTSHLVEDYSSYFAAMLLAGIGIWSIISAFREAKIDRVMQRRLTSLTGIVLIALAISLDNLIVGFSLGINDVNPLNVASTIAIFSMIFTAIGLKVGAQTRRHWEKVASIVAGLLLIGLGLAEFWEFF